MLERLPFPGLAYKARLSYANQHPAHIPPHLLSQALTLWAIVPLPPPPQHQVPDNPRWPLHPRAQ